MRALAPFLVLTLFAFPAGASACTPTTSPALAVGDHYVTEDCLLADALRGDLPSGCHGGLLWLWVYEESNAIPGLQRGDEIVDDTCRGAIPSDTIRF